MGPIVSRAGALAFAIFAAALVTSCIVAVTTAGPAYPTSNLEWNVERPGAEYRSFDLRDAQPRDCQSTCMNEPQCMAFTYVNPGVQGPNARCWLQERRAAAVPQACCVSGVKYGRAAASGRASSRRRPRPRRRRPRGRATPTTPPPPPPAPPPPSAWQGTPTTPPPPPPPPPPGRPLARNADHAARAGAGSGSRRPIARAWTTESFDLPAPRPELCRDACWRDAQCRAFTYVRPGVQGPNARCA